MKTTKFLLAIFFFSGVLAGAKAQTLDQSQLIYNAGLSARNLSGNSIFQSFTCGITGTLSEIDMGVFNAINGIGVLKIYSGIDTTGTLLQTTPVSINCPSGNCFTNFPTSVSVTAGQVYTFRFIPGAGIPDPYGVQLQSPGAYTGGQLGIISGGISYPGDDIVFKTFVRKKAPVLISPANVSSNWTGLLLDWGAVSGSQFYQLQVDTSTSFNSPVLFNTTKAYINSSSANTDTEHSINNLFFGKTYYWRVRAYSTGDTSTWSQQNFTTRDYVTLVAPTTASSDWTGVLLDWAAHTGVSFYDVQADTVTTFNSPALTTASKTYINSSSVNTDTEHSLNNLYFGKTYYWRVRARNTVDTSLWSTTWTFNTRDYVTLLSPTNGQINVNIAGTTLDWAAHTGIAVYQMQKDTTYRFNSPLLVTTNQTYINSSSANIDTQFPTGALLLNQIYYWRVRAINLVDTSAWTTFLYSTGSCTPPLQAVSITGNTIICSGSPNTYSVVPVAGATSYTWTLPGTWTGTSTTNSINATADVTSGNVVVTANNACGASAPQTVAITVNLLPVTSYVQTPSTACVNSTSVLLSSGTPAGGVYSGVAVTGNTFNATMAGVGTYTITYTYTDVNSCIGSATSSITVSSCVGIQENENNLSLVIYPNPTSSTITVKNIENLIQISICNAIGELIYSKQITKNEFEIDLSNQTSGLYFVKITTDKGTVVKQVVKE